MNNNHHLILATLFYLTKKTAGSCS